MQSYLFIDSSHDGLNMRALDSGGSCGGTQHLLSHAPRNLTLSSSSAWAKKAAALRRISLARFNSLTSRSSSLRRSRSELDRPGRFAWSRSACRTYLRKVSPVQPILLAIETIADH